MKQEDKKLLLGYLSMALPYYLQVMVKVMLKEDDEPYTLLSIHPNKDIALIGIDMDGVYATSKVKIDTIKPYLRPLSSMTEKEVEEFVNLQENFFKYCKNQYVGVLTITALDWLNAHHFDYRGLIDKGLAIEVTKENNPYSITEGRV